MNYEGGKQASVSELASRLCTCSEGGADACAFPGWTSSFPGTASFGSWSSFLWIFGKPSLSFVQAFFSYCKSLLRCLEKPPWCASGSLLFLLKEYSSFLGRISCAWFSGAVMCAIGWGECPQACGQGGCGSRGLCKTQCAACDDAACCDSRCSALRWLMYRTASLE